MNILVTGHTGFLGRHLLKKLDNGENRLFYSNRSVNNLLKPLNGEGHEPLDYIFHLAADTKAGDYCLYHQGDQWVNNQLLNTNIVRYWNEYQPQAKMITFGTSCGYADDEENKVEENYLVGKPNERLNVYAMTKRMLLLGLESMAEQYNMEYLYFIPNTLYGPEFELTDRHFIFEIIQKIAAAKYEGKTAVLWGSGNQQRELLYIDDVVDSILDNLHLSNKRINLGTGKQYTIKTYAQIVCEILDYDFNKLEFDTDAYEGQLSKVLQPSKDIGPCDKTNLLTGITNTVNYYVKNKYNISL